MGFLSGAIYARTKTFIMLITQMRDKILPRKPGFRSAVPFVGAQCFSRAVAHGQHAGGRQRLCTRFLLPLRVRDGPTLGASSQSKQWEVPPALADFCFICQAGRRRLRGWGLCRCPGTAEDTAGEEGGCSRGLGWGGGTKSSRSKSGLSVRENEAFQ